MRAQLASATTRVVNATSRRLGRGQGTVAGGRAGLRLDPRLLEHLSAGRQIALVTGTNGKTTTTRLLTVGLGANGDAVVSNETGSNMPPGHVAALVGTEAPRAVLETDEIYLPRVLTATAAATVVLLNLSRDQLDRTNEVRMIAGSWRAALAAAPHTHVVANADDPLVAWGAGAARDVHWVGAGLRWQHDAVGCPSCGGRITFADDGWSCAGCGFARPDPEATLVVAADGTARAEWADGRSAPVRLALPGPLQPVQRPDGGRRRRGVRRRRPRGAGGHGGGAGGRGPLHGARVRRRAGAAHAGQEPGGLGRVARPGGGVGRAARRQHQRADRRRGGSQLVVGRALRAPAGRAVVATGDRFRDLSVRLHYGGVRHSTEPDPVLAVAAAAAAGSDSAAVVDVIGNYTAFHDLLGAPA